MKIIDLRSDTVTLPTIEMRDAMYQAVVGDDVYEDDPTVKELEELASRMTGMEAALFVPSGTFGNQLALLTHANRGDEVILEANCHIKKYEVASSAVIAGVQLHTIEGKLGKMPLDEITKAIRSEDIHFPSTKMICLENATGLGTLLDLDYMKEVRSIANKNDVLIHLDGARVFNAATALNVDVKDLCQQVDSVMFCLSKGLCAPVGSILAGSKTFIEKARKNRKLMGGGLRQVGVLAAPGLIALERMSNRLGEDHENAQYFADQIETIDGIHVIRERLTINMVFVTVDETQLKLPEDIDVQLKEKGIKIGGYRNGFEMRFAMHHGITRTDIDYVIETIKNLI